MPRKFGRGSKKNRGGGPGGSQGPRGGGTGSGGSGTGVSGGGRGRPGRGQRGHPVKAGHKSDYFMQPGRRGIVVVLRRPIGNRADAKICGTMPSRIHAKL